MNISLSGKALLSRIVQILYFYLSETASIFNFQRAIAQCFYLFDTITISKKSNLIEFASRCLANLWDTSGVLLGYEPTDGTAITLGEQFNETVVEKCLEVAGDRTLPQKPSKNIGDPNLSGRSTRRLDYRLG